MKVAGQTEQIKETIHKSHKVTLVTANNPTPELMNSVTVWKTILARRNKEVTIIAPNWEGEVPDGDTVLKTLPPRRTTIKVGLNDQQVKKISYEIKEGALYLYLTPEKGVILGDQVEVSSDQLQTDLMITFGVNSAEVLSDWPASWPSDIKSYAPIVNIDIDTHNSQFGSINLIEGEYGSFSHLTFELLKALDFECDVQGAKLLLSGITSTTHNFTQQVNSRIFETAAELMRIIEGEVA